MTRKSQRAFQAMMGLAIGDALGWPAMFHRSLMLPPWTRRIRREMDAAMETTSVSRLPMPFSLNQPGAAFRPGPTDDSEWAAFTARRLIMTAGVLNEQTTAESWIQLANQSTGIRGPVNVMTALANLRKGIMPPASGHDNPHYFDDSALCRVMPVGIVWAGEPERAAHNAETEAAVTNSEDGLWTAGAYAAAVSIACAGGDTDEIVDEALGRLPGQSWCRRLAEKGVLEARKASTMLAAIPLLNDTLVNREYSYGSAAPETFALTLAIMQICGRDFERAVTAACSFAKTADSLPALVGALCGAMSDEDFVSESWTEQLSALQGICLPHLAGVDYVQLSRELATLAETSAQRS